jgi:hypothetical protein
VDPRACLGIWGKGKILPMSGLLLLLTNKPSNPYTELDRPLGFQQVEVHRVSRQSVHEGGKVGSRTHRPPLPPGDTLVTYFC